MSKNANCPRGGGALQLSALKTPWALEQPTVEKDSSLRLRRKDAQSTKREGYQSVTRSGHSYPCAELTGSLSSDKDQCQKLDLPSNCNQVTIFVDSQTESIATTERTGKDGRGNEVLTTLYLYRLGAFDQVLRFLGLLSTLYVMNAAPWSETSSQSIGNQNPQDVDA